MDIVGWLLNALLSKFGHIATLINLTVCGSSLSIMYFIYRALKNKRKLNKWLEEKAPQIDPNWSISEKTEFLLQDVNSDIVKQRIQTIVRNVVQLGKTDVETLSGITAQIFIKWDILFSFITASLVTVGLLGTFLGLTQTLGGLFSGVGLESLAKFSSKVSQALNGIEFAFQTSLYGLMGALIINGLHTLKKISERVFLKELDRLTVEYLLPIFQPEDVYADFRLVAEEMRKILSEIHDSANTLNILADQLEFDQERYDQTIRVFQSAADSLTQRDDLIQSAMKRIENLQKDLRGTIQEQGDTLNQYLSGINALGGQVARLITTVGHGQKDTQNILGAFNAVLQKWSENLERIDSSHQQNADKYRQLLEELNSLTDFLKDRTENITRNTEEVVLKLDDKIAAGFEAIARQVEEMTAKFATSGQMITEKLEGAISDNLRDLHKQVEELTETLTASGEMIAEKMEKDHSEQLLDYLERIQNGLTALKDALQNNARGLQEQLTGLLERGREVKRTPVVKERHNGEGGNGRNLPAAVMPGPARKGFVAGLYDKIRARFNTPPFQN
ncbi:MAG: hypothetical protein Kow0037_30920 [Calditrichia bacterium]